MSILVKPRDYRRCDECQLIEALERHGVELQDNRVEEGGFSPIRYHDDGVAHIRLISRGYVELRRDEGTGDAARDSIIQLGALLVCDGIRVFCPRDGVDIDSTPVRVAGGSLRCETAEDAADKLAECLQEIAPPQLRRIEVACYDDWFEWQGIRWPIVEVEVAGGGRIDVVVRAHPALYGQAVICSAEVVGGVRDEFLELLYAAVSFSGIELLDVSHLIDDDKGEKSFCVDEPYPAYFIGYHCVPC